ncbi:Carnitine O-palmitoyltransferase 1, liver isoform [Portunus trituberculatus]|uniref:Carnitine O-palmitoyltransferase 1, liver isoform n=1 Tax=Portunus trituberculatus TaxID=210409 RepID=A0A5B7D106_PORTR|nr:Carnitine O-palmitoyltransferase 1, liver isoform [Portunus trituberculatus]
MEIWRQDTMSPAQTLYNTTRADAAIMSHLWEYVLTEDLIALGADAPIMGHMWEYIMGEDIFEFGYDDDGNCVGKVTCNPPVPSRLKWELNQECLQAIDTSFRPVAKQLPGKALQQALEPNLDICTRG